MRNHNCICATCCNAVRSLATPATAASYPFMMTATKITYHPYNRNENIIACCSRAAVTSACSPAARRHRCLPYSTQCCTVIFLIVIKRRRIRIDEVPSTTTRVPNGPTPLPRRPPIHAPSPPHPTRACACGWVGLHTSPKSTYVMRRRGRPRAAPAAAYETRPAHDCRAHSAPVPIH